MRFAVYEIATGAILRLTNREGQARDGQGVVTLPDGFSGNDTTHAVIDGQVVEIS